MLLFLYRYLHMPNCSGMRLFDKDGLEIGGGVFPLAAYRLLDDPAAAAYADALSEARTHHVVAEPSVAIKELTERSR